jgi:hypothetical protein
MSKGVRQAALGFLALALLIASILLGLREQPATFTPAVAELAPAPTPSAAGAEPGAQPTQTPPVWTIAEVVRSPKLVAEMGLAIDRCRDLRVDFATGKADRASGSDLLVGGKATSCEALFDAYDGQMAQLLAPLRRSEDPVQRGYFFDGRYNDLTADHHLLFVATDDPAIAAQQADYFKKTDEHFEEVLKDADNCVLDSMVRLSLSHRLASPRYNTPEAKFFVAYILVVLSYENAAIVDNMQRLGKGLAQARLDEIKMAVFGAMMRCGTGNFAAAIAPYFSKG